MGNVRFYQRLFLLVLTLSMGGLTGAVAQSNGAVWGTWAALDIGSIGDDHTGSVVATSDEVTTPEGGATIQVTPSGSAEETKLAIPLTGAQLADLATADSITLEVYLPEANRLNADQFFMGMADVTGGGFEWVAGIFGAADGESGWVRVTYPLDPAMQSLQPERLYNLYLSFFSSQGKQPLSEPFYLGPAYLNLMQVAEATAVRASLNQEVRDLLAMDDAALIDAIAHKTFNYFWQEANPANGLVKDRSTPDSVASIAAVGFGLGAIPLATDRGWIGYDEGYQRVLMTLKTFVNGDVEGHNGFFFHFVNMKTGRREWGSELSSIDTALLVAGAVVAGEYFKGTDVEPLAAQLTANVQWDWMADGGSLLRMGWTPEGGFFDATWGHFDESLLMYALAVSSPTHASPASGWDRWYRPVDVKGDYIYLPGEPLFVYQYPLAFLDLKGQEDYYANYWNNAVKACQRNWQFSLDHSDQYATYQNGVWGLSASDGPSGYSAYGAADDNHDGTIAPYASASCSPFTPDIALTGMRAMLQTYGVKVWGEYGFVSAINADEDWYSHDSLGIDEGDILLMLANTQDGFIWKQFMANVDIQRGLADLGFVPSTGDYAVTPAYMAQKQ